MHSFDVVCDPVSTVDHLLRGIDRDVIKANANRSRKTTGDEPVDLRDPRHAIRAVCEYLAALDEQDESSTPPAAISPTDAAARWTAAPGGQAFPSPKGVSFDTDSHEAFEVAT